ncbi:hypothetical protein ARMGADRAFT_1033905 [Armillaria gallica]|uniref:Uncharacterized protein n=1 Tax=Armillaria gallica TaxID=47427 RepID=A0A2H3CZR8_ARMGA|nr:hypothetical protein ARMGADRAFT_1033905 [Armillaria gallica]
MPILPQLSESINNNLMELDDNEAHPDLNNERSTSSSSDEGEDDGSNEEDEDLSDDSSNLGLDNMLENKMRTSKACKHTHEFNTCFVAGLPFNQSLLCSPSHSTDPISVPDSASMVSSEPSATLTPSVNPPDMASGSHLIVMGHQQEDSSNNTALQRSTRKWKAIDIGSLRECLCGHIVEEEKHLLAAICCRKGCETVWTMYRLDGRAGHAGKGSKGIELVMAWEGRWRMCGADSAEHSGPGIPYMESIMSYAHVIGREGLGLSTITIWYLKMDKYHHCHCTIKANFSDG